MIPRALRIFSILLSLTCAGTATSAVRQVIIDPGHGGHDRGAHKGYYFEKHLALDVSYRLEKFLESRGLKATLTRTRDNFISLDSRPSLSNRTRDAIFVSIHFNSAYRSGAAGIETFYYKSTSKNLARYIQGNLIRSCRATDRGVKYAAFRVLRLSKKPACLVECGFMSNSRERAKCLDPAYRQRLAEAIGLGILAYKKAS